MTTLLITGLIIATWHFIYEGIIAPSIRLHLRNKLFALRDEIRAIHLNDIAKQDRQAFWFVHDGINNLLNRLPALTLERSSKLKRAYSMNPALGKALDAHIEKVRSARDPAILDVFNRTNKVIIMVLVTNAGGWLIYIVPIGIVVALAGKVKRLTAKLSRLGVGLLLTPESTIELVIPRRKQRA